jgi:hypothetical protein
MAREDARQHLLPEPSNQGIRAAGAAVRRRFQVTVLAAPTGAELDTLQAVQRAAREELEHRPDVCGTGRVMHIRASIVDQDG